MGKKICFVLPTLRKGGLERVVSLLSNNLINVSKVSVITLTDDLVEYPLNDLVKVIHLNKKEKFNRFLLVIQLIKALKKTSPNVVVGFSEVFNPITLLAAKCLKLKVFVSDRSNPLIDYSLRDKLLKRITYKFSDGIIAQTELAKNVLLENKINSNITVIPNPISIFNNQKVNAASKKIVTLGRLVKTKNQIELIEIFNEIDNDGWELIIAGEGNSREELQNYIKEQRLSKVVHLIGKVNDIEKLFSNASIFAFTSLSEGFPNALMEGMAYPLATIAYDCPAGVSDLIENNINGYLIPLHDKEVFKVKLKELMNSEEKRLEFMKHSIKIRDKYSQETISSAFYSFVTQ